MIEQVKKVTTFDSAGKENGWLLELSKDGNKTTSYLTAAFPGAFKGFHLHRIREANYIAIRGRVEVTTYARNSDNTAWEKTVTVLDAKTPQKFTIGINMPTGLKNIGDEEVWIVNNPNPAYDPTLKDEQVEYTEVELLANRVK